MHLRRSSDAPERLVAALAHPLNGDPGPAITLNAATIPSDLRADHQEGAKLGALHDALLRGNLDTMDRVRALASRLGLLYDIPLVEPRHALYSVLVALNEKCKGAEQTAQALVAAFATPLDVRPVVDDGLPKRGTLGESLRISKAAGEHDDTFIQQLKDTLLAVTDTHAKAFELAYRMNISALRQNLWVFLAWR